MRTRIVNDRPVTNRDGAAEIVGRSRATVDRWASPARRQATGWPAVVDRHGGEEWYYVDELEGVRDGYVAITTARGRPTPITDDGDPDELLTATEVRKLLRIAYGTWSGYVADSLPAWERGDDGYLPLPDHEEPAARGGVTRSWRRGRIVSWNQNRPGKTAATGRPAAPATT